jgi:ferrous iron transport protein A
MRFFGGASKGNIKQDKSSPSKGLYLDTSIRGENYTMMGLEGGQRFREKIYSMGLNPGVKFTVLQNPGHGPVEIEVRQTRLAIGRGMAAKIKVRQNGGSG